MRAARFEAALAFLALGCATSVNPPGGPDCVVVPVPASDLPADLSLRTRMTLVAGETPVHLETVARSTDDGLVVVGLAPYGLRLFTLRQRGRAFSVEGAAGRDPGPVPLWVADALHRIYWIQPPPGLAVDCWERAGERVSERRGRGGLRREFASVGAAPDSRPVSIRYPGRTGPRVIEIHNPHCGYAARVVTLEGAGIPSREDR